MRVTKKEAAKFLGIGLRTLEKRMASGAIQFEKEPQTSAFKGSARVTVILPDPASPQSTSKLLVHEPFGPGPDRPLSAIELKADADRKFAAAYLRGDATDSAGNTIHGTNEVYPSRGPTSVLGPMVREDGPPLDSQAHMHPALLGNVGPAERHPFDRGLSDDALKAMRADWNRHGGGPSQGEMREAAERSRAMIRAAFNYARQRSKP